MFTHLRLHSEFSLSSGMIRPKELVQIIAARNVSSHEESHDGQSNSAGDAITNINTAVAITDSNNIFGLIKFYKAALAAKVKPILGCEIKVRSPAGVYKLVLLCKNNHGYINLCEIVSAAYLTGQRDNEIAVDIEEIIPRTSGLIALSAAHDGLIGKCLINGQFAEARECLEYYKQLFNNEFYIEVQRIGKAVEDTYLPRALELAQTSNTPAVATNDVCFIAKNDFAAHEARTCISSGNVLTDNNRPRNYTEQQYLKTDAEMTALFADYPQLVKNSELIAQKCNVKLDLGHNFLPAFENELGLSEADYLAKLAREGLEERLIQLFKQATKISEVRKQYDDRLLFEIDVINQMGFPGYFLIVADFIKWAKSNDIPVGPGRGSGAGSLVAYSLGITDLDPLEYDLLFERFLNPERVSMPDFDIDFCMAGRDRVIDYVATKYGRDKVSQIATHGTMAAKAVVRDVGRVLGNGYSFVDGIAKLIPNELGITLSKALTEPDMKARYETDDEVKTLIDLALPLEGLARNVGKHAGGVVIAPSKLTDFSALYCEEDRSSMIVQYDKDDIEAAGLVKFDFLGLRTLTIIDWAVKNINLLKTNSEPKLAILDIPLDDKATYNLLKNCQTTAVFQLESSGIKDLIKRLQPDRFEDIIALVALFRPGPLGSGMVDDFINVKHGRQAPDYLHPSLKDILEPTYGVILYQEQVMQIAQVLARYTLGEADMLRRAMGKKKPEEMAKQRSLFTDGATKNGVDVAKATYIFDLMEKFAGYGFNKSHSAAYALLAYQTAWLKTHYPENFMAAVLSADIDNTDKIVTLIDECRNMGIKIKNPSVNQSVYKFSVNDDNEIVYGLGAIKGAGEGAIESIIEQRVSQGVFVSVADFFLRNDISKINKRVAEALVKSGAFDDLDSNRRALFENLPVFFKLAEQTKQNKQSGQLDMFGMQLPSSQDTSANLNLGNMTQIADWNAKERLQLEKNILGLYLTGHPVESYRAELRSIVGLTLDKTLANMAQQDKRSRYQRNVYLAGIISSLRVKQGQRGKMAFVTLDDCSARTEVRFFAQAYEAAKDLLVEDEIVIIKGKVVYDDFADEFKVNAEQTFSIDAVRENFTSDVQIKLNADVDVAKFKQQIAPLLVVNKGFDVNAANGTSGIVGINSANATGVGNDVGANVWLEVVVDKTVAKFSLKKHKLVLNKATMQQLTEILGQDSLQLKYKFMSILDAPTD